MSGGMETPDQRDEFIGAMMARPTTQHRDRLVNMEIRGCADAGTVNARIGPWHSILYSLWSMVLFFGEAAIVRVEIKRVTKSKSTLESQSQNHSQNAVCYRRRLFDTAF